MELFTSINPAEAAIIATVFSALLILAIILSVRAYFYQSKSKEDAKLLTSLSRSNKQFLDENLRLKTEHESLATRCTNLLASLHEMEHRNEKNKALLVEQEKIHQTAVENAAKYAICESWLSDNGYRENKENNHVLDCLRFMDASIHKYHAIPQPDEELKEEARFYRVCKHFVDQNNLVEGSEQRTDNVVIETLQTLTGKVINYDKEIGNIRAEFEKYGAKFKTIRNTHGQVAEKLATMHKKTTELVLAASQIPRLGQVPRDKFTRLMAAAAACATIKKANDGIREEGVCA